MKKDTSKSKMGKRDTSKMRKKDTSKLVKKESKNGTVDFVDSFNSLKKVRGLLTKRAKQYDSDSD